MPTVTFDEARTHFGAYCDQVVEDRDAIVIARAHGRNVVLISEDKWESIQESLRLEEDSVNREALDESLRQAEVGEVHRFASIDDLHGYVASHL